MGTQAAHVGVCVYGAGRWGRNLIRCLHELEAAVAVIDPDPAARRFVEESWGLPTFAIDSDLPRELQKRITASVIATPAATHTYLAMKALGRNQDVFVEKPMALKVEDAQLIHQEARRRGQLLMIGHILLYHPAIRHLKRLMDRGELGTIRYLYSSRLNLGVVRREENILWSFAPHDIAVILHLLGQEPVTVQATGGSWLQSGIKDVTVTHLSFPGGEKAHVFVSWLHPFKEQKLVVVGSRKMAVFDALREDAQLVILDSGIDLDAAGMATARRGEEEIPSLPLCEPLMEEMRHFLHACATREQPLTHGQHGVHVMSVLARAQAMLEDQDQGKNASLEVSG